MEEFDNGLDKKFTFNFNEPCTFSVDIEKLKTFIAKDPEAVLIFYGGEPLLQINKIKQIMDEINVPYRMQTNGLLLNLLEPKYLNRITKILVSIDGDKGVSDNYRGVGTFDKIVNNLKLMKKNGYKGELIARMTVAQDNPDIYTNVQSILEIGLFDAIHWQLDVGFYKTDFEQVKIEDFFQKYNASVSMLIDFWMDKIHTGEVLKFYPFFGIVKSLLNPDDKETKYHLRCGAGYKGYAITTGGNVQACPIMNNIEDFKAGTIETEPKDLKKFDVGECANCSYLQLCGGRCMYWRKASLWPKEGDDLICDSTKFYIDKIIEKFPEIVEDINNKIITKSDFNYEKYFGPEIIP